MERKHQHLQSGEGINFPSLNHHSSEMNFESQSDSELDSMETDVADLDADSVSDSIKENVVDLIEEIHNSFLKHLICVIVIKKCYHKSMILIQKD